MPTLVSISGGPGSGKTTLLDELAAATGGTLVPSNTTRKRRPADLSGEYRYWSEKDFCLTQGFIWKVCVHGAWYGTRKEDVDSALRRGNGVALLALTVPFHSILSHVYRDEETITHHKIHLCSPRDTVLAERLLRRDETEEDIARRIQEAEEWDTDARRANLVCIPPDSRERTLTRCLRLLQPTSITIKGANTKIP